MPTTRTEVSETASAAETEAIGAGLAERLSPGDLVTLSGDLGAGKSTLVRGACRALGITEPVTSPTFTIGRLYETPSGTRIAHLDLYRLVGSGEEEEPGLLDDYLGAGTITFAEWPEVAAGLLGREPVATVRLAHRGGDRRSVEVEWASEPTRPAIATG